MSAAVNCLETDMIMNLVSGVLGVPEARSASPYALRRSVRPFFWTRTTPENFRSRIGAARASSTARSRAAAAGSTPEATGDSARSGINSNPCTPTDRRPALEINANALRVKLVFRSLRIPFLGRPMEGYGLSDRQSTDASDRAVDSRVVLVRTNDRL